MILVKNDALSIAVVCCLFVVPPDELEREELTSIVDIAGTCPNVGAGEAETILAVVHWIFCKLTAVATEHLLEDEYQSSLLFQREKGAEALQISLDLLASNIDERREEESDSEKYPLSLSILNFLKCASRAENMRGHIEEIPGKSDILKKLLISEDRFGSGKVSTCPIDIENTALALDLSVLIEII